MTTGEKIRQFRESSKLSQFQLELLIEAAPGSISRIESGNTNPTKETLFKMAKALDLTQVETSYLLGLNDTETFTEDFEKIEGYITGMLSNSHSYCYVLNTRSEIMKFSHSFEELLGFTDIDFNTLIGKNIAEVIFNGKYGLKSLISNQSLPKVFSNIISVFVQERAHIITEPWWEELKDKLKYIPEFNQYYEQISRRPFNFMSIENRTIQLNIKQYVIEMVFTPIFLYQDPRYTIVQYIPNTESLKILKRVLPYA